MKKIYSIIAFLIVSIGFAQIPAGYYNTATGTGYTLKTQLYNIIKVSTDQGYDGLWTTYGTSDRDDLVGTGYENDNTIYDIYSENPTGSANECGFIYITSEDTGSGGTSECQFYNREHIIPQSVFASANPMHNDAHFIPPADKKVNGIRADYPHGTVSSSTYVSNNGSKLGTSSVSGYVGTVFEPNDAFKGDIARMYFYFATRYENTVSGYSYEMFNGTSNQVFTTPFLNMLLAWNAADPVSPREIERNNAIYARQNNRNPFIDHPEYANVIWGCPADAIAPTAPTALAVSGSTPTTISLTWTAATDNTGVSSYDVYVNGVFSTSTSGTTITVNGLTSSTSYNFYVIAKDCQANPSPASNIANGSTTAPSTGGTATELFFSEYVEGTGNNKALEIINLTGATVDLSTYSVKRQTNGAGAWSSGIALTGNLTNGSVFVIVNTATASPCTLITTPNLSTAVAEMTFNGNDPMGLFKSGVLIDIIGVFDGGAPNFSIDETLRRKSTVTSPNTTFNKATEWTTFAVNTCDGLGDSTLSVNEIKDDLFSIYPNPSNGNFTITFKDTVNNFDVEVFSTIGQKVFETKQTSNQNISINNLQQGIYLVKVTKDSKSIVKKIVIN